MPSTDTSATSTTRTTRTLCPSSSKRSKHRSHRITNGPQCGWKKDVGDGELNCSPLVNMCSNLLNFGYADSRGFGILKTIWRQREGFVTLSVVCFRFSLFLTFLRCLGIAVLVRFGKQSNGEFRHYSLGFGLWAFFCFGWCVT
jgi:hypothetical protein